MRYIDRVASKLVTAGFDSNQTDALLPKLKKVETELIAIVKMIEKVIADKRHMNHRDKDLVEEVATLDDVKAILKANDICKQRLYRAILKQH